MSVAHYENFPVASIFLPRPLRPPVVAIYRFARHADDLADEGDATPSERLHALERFRVDLAHAFQGASTGDPVLDELSKEAKRWQLPQEPFDDLLDAFVQDQRVTHYADFNELLGYCRRSANPVGRLLLHLYGVKDAGSLTQSDAICTALQLINFCQDLAIDLARGRVYLPQDECQRFGITPETLCPPPVSPSWNALLQLQRQRAREMLLSGAPLTARLPGRIGFELKLIVEGGLRILEKLDHAGGAVLSHRPTLGILDACLMLARACFRRWKSS